MPGVIMAALFENTLYSGLMVSGTAALVLVVGQLGSATPVARHACCDNCTFLNNHFI
jgi:hypothetical protein